MIDRLALFFTSGMSLVGWERVGMLERELLLYRRLAERGVLSSFLTYGGRNEARMARGVAGLRIGANDLSLPMGLYEACLPWIHFRLLRQAQLVKSNQLQGAGQALRAARLWNKQFYLRCGYLLSDYLAWRDGPDSGSCRRALAMEDRLFAAANVVAVPNAWAARQVARRVPAAGKRVIVHPNFVDVDQFRPQDGMRPNTDIAFVGRLDEQKDIVTLIAVLKKLGAPTALIVGDGPLSSGVQELVANSSGRIVWKRRVDHAELPGLLADCKLFLFPSRWEGHPKALLEAMAVGLPYLASDIPAIRSLAPEGEAGLLVEPGHADRFAEAAQALLADETRRRSMGELARQIVLSSYTLDKAVEREMAAFDKALATR